MKVFISHAQDEKALAQAWKALLERLGIASVWFSSDVNASGGVGSGPWREKIHGEIEQADVVLAILTAESARRPWIIFECAFAMGLSSERMVIPITFFMNTAGLPSPMENLLGYAGDDMAKVLELCTRLRQKATGSPGDERFMRIAVEMYKLELEQYSQQWMSHYLFHRHFHNLSSARQLEGQWFAKWTQLGTSEESVFEVDSLKVWTTEERLRIVGAGAKGENYPMEGVVSARGHVALSYWSAREIPICGSAVLELLGDNTIMEGVWHGFTAPNFRDRLKLLGGRVVIGRVEEEVTDYWGLRPRPVKKPDPPPPTPDAQSS